MCKSSRAPVYVDADTIDRLLTENAKMRAMLEKARDRLNYTAKLIKSAHWDYTAGKLTALANDIAALLAGKE